MPTNSSVSATTNNRHEKTRTVLRSSFGFSECFCSKQNFARRLRTIYTRTIAVAWFRAQPSAGNAVLCVVWRHQKARSVRCSLTTPAEYCPQKSLPRAGWSSHRARRLGFCFISGTAGANFWCGQFLCQCRSGTARRAGWSTRRYFANQCARPVDGYL